MRPRARARAAEPRLTGAADAPADEREGRPLAPDSQAGGAPDRRRGACGLHFATEFTPEACAVGSSRYRRASSALALTQGGRETAATNEISRSAMQAAQGTQDVSADVAKVLASSDETGSAAAQGLSAAADLATQSSR